MDFPDYLYRYRPAVNDHLEDELKAAIERNEVWCQRLDQLNDPFEADPVFIKQRVPEVRAWIVEFRLRHGLVSTTGEGYEEMADRFGISKSKLRGLFGDPTKAAQQELKSSRKLANMLRRAGVSCSFSETGTSTAMWALYANDHRGYCQIWR